MTQILPPATPGRSGLDYLPGRLPEAQIDSKVNCVKIVENALQDLEMMPEDTFTDDALWRDQLAMCGTFRTIYGGKGVRSAWKEIAKERKPTNIKFVESSAKVTWLGATNSFVEGMFEFETMGGELPSTCSGFVYIVPSADKTSGWRIWCLMTILEQFKGYEQDDLRLKYPELPMNGLNLNGNAMNMNGNEHSEGLETRVDAIVLGAGQSGLCMASYLQASGISYVALERNKKIGDNWALRYDCLKLHTPHKFNDLAFGPTFTEEKGYSEWLTKDELAKGYQDHAARFHINVWTSSNVVSCHHSKETMLWTLKVDRNGTIYTVIGRHLILSTGPGGTIPIRPTYPGREIFKGEVLHSKDYKSAAGWKGSKGLVIGTANTGHDVAEDMLNSGLSSVTMAQRNKTFVLPRDYNTAFFDIIWTPDRSGELADKYFWAPPVQVARLATMNFLDPLFAEDYERFDRLEMTGFKLDRNGDFIEMLLVKFGGHFMDHGCSEKISKGRIKMKSDAAPVAYTPRGLKFSDGQELEADVIVFATGFEKDTTESAAKIVGEEIASQLDPFWGCDEEGEVRGAFKPCGYPNLWMTGGGCAHARYYTRFVAMQIKADMLGRPLKLYAKTPVE